MPLASTSHPSWVVPFGRVLASNLCGERCRGRCHNANWGTVEGVNLASTWRKRGSGLPPASIFGSPTCRPWTPLCWHGKGKVYGTADRRSQPSGSRCLPMTVAGCRSRPKKKDLAACDAVVQPALPQRHEARQLGGCIGPSHGGPREGQMVCQPPHRIDDDHF